MEQRMHEKIDEGIGRLEKLMIDMNQSRRRNSPESIHGGSRISPHSDRERRESQDHRNVDNRSRRNVMIMIDGMLVVGVVVEMLEDVNDNDILQILMRNLLVTEGVCIEIENKHDVRIEM